MFPKLWLKSMLKAREREDPNIPTVINGPVVFGRINPLLAACRNIAYWRFLIKTLQDQTSGPCGMNVLVDLKDDQTLESVLEMPNFWPRDDVALRDTILDHGGQYVKIINLAAIALTDGVRFPDLLTRFQLGGAKTRELIDQSYLEEAAPGSMPYKTLD